MRDGKTGLAVIETTRPGPPWLHSRGERGLQRPAPLLPNCSQPLLAHSPAPHSQPRSAAGAQLCSGLATEALWSRQTTERPLSPLDAPPRPGSLGQRVAWLCPWVSQAPAWSQPTPCAHEGGCSGCPAVPVSLALIEHLHLPENPAPDVSQALLYDLEGKEGEAQGEAALPGRGRGTPAPPAVRGPAGPGGERSPAG